MKYILLGFLSLFSFSVSAANIYVIDSGLHPSYYSSIQGRLLFESCHSFDGDQKRMVATDPNNAFASHIYEYLYASLCRNKLGEQHGSGASLLRTHDLPGTIGKNGFPDRSVEVISDTHQSVIADVIKDNTSARVKQWHVHTEGLIGKNLVGGLDYLTYNTLTQESNIVFVNKALESLADGPLNGVKVVSMSLIFPASEVSQARYTTPCDNHADILASGALRNVTTQITRLRNQGITVVVGTANTANDPDLDNYEMPFPSCLSTTVAVGGIDATGKAQGALGPHTDFIENYSHRDPVTSGIVTGTSYATPKVASYLTELVTINPTLSSSQALNALRSTGNQRCQERVYNNGALRISFCIIQPNFESARDSIVDNFWKDIVELFVGDTDEGSYGWNYGTSRHSNGLLSTFSTTSQQQNINQSFELIESVDVKAETANAGQAVLKYSFRPFDIDTQDEVEFLINDKSLGFVQTTGSNQLGSTQTFCIENADLNSNGSNNEVKLQLKTSGETWGVKNLKVSSGTFDASCQNTLPDSNNESVSLTLGTINTNQYGRNYGRDNNTTQLDVQFSAVAGRTHELSWQAYDIESNEMEVFLNDQKIKTIPSTGSNQLGSVDNIIMPSTNLLAGTNTVSFRVTGGDQKWGITNLLAESNNTVPGQPSSEILLEDLPWTRFTHNNRAHDFVFDFTPRGPDYDETITLSFEIYQQGGGNGFKIYVNGVKKHTFPRMESTSPWSWIPLSVTLDKSHFRTGSNTITITTTSSVVFDNEESSHRNVRIVSNATPFLDVAVSDARVTTRRPFTAIANVVNISAKNSAANTVTFYVSSNSNKSNPATLGSTSVSAMTAGSSREVTYPANSSVASNGKYIWACVGVESGDRNPSNNCSDAVIIDKGVVMAPIYMLLD